MELGPLRTKAAASPAIASVSEPSISSPGMVTDSSMPPVETHHRSSPAPTHPQSAAGPETWVMISLASSVVGTGRPRTLERTGPVSSSASTTNGSLPTSANVAVRCTDTNPLRLR